MVFLESPIFVIGILGMVLGGAFVTRNVAAAFGGFLWSLSVIILIFVELFGIGIELFWVMLSCAMLMVAVGWIARVIT